MQYPILEIAVILLVALVIGWRVYAARARNRSEHTPTLPPTPTVTAQPAQPVQHYAPEVQPPSAPAAMPTPVPLAAPVPVAPLSGNLPALDLPDWVLDELAAYEAGLMEGSGSDYDTGATPPTVQAVQAVEVDALTLEPVDAPVLILPVLEPVQPEPEPEEPEPFYEPAQLMLDREVQLQAAMPEQEAPAPVPVVLDTSIPRLPVASIRPGDNDRTQFDPIALQELAEDIAANGLAQPITVRPMYTHECGHTGPLGGNRCKACALVIADSEQWYQIVAGERRFRAISQVLGWLDAPVIIRSMSDKEASAVMLAENVHRVDLNPLDEARAYEKRMTEYGWSVTECAQNAKVPPARVKSRLALLTLIPDAQLLVKSGNLGIGYAECMQDLDANRQALALRYFSDVKRPTVAEFRLLCGQLLSEQAQDSLFDVDSFMQGCNEAAAAQLSDRKTRRFPVSDRVPPMPRGKTVGAVLEQYIADLLASGELEHQEAAGIVGRVYEGLLQSNLAKPPKESPLTPAALGATQAQSPVPVELAA